LLMPVFILFLGVALDLGWYYLNVSRLQNAADAAAVAGAQTLIDSDNFSDYKNVTLISKYPGKVSNKYRANDVYELTTIENGKTAAQDYAGKNLSGKEGVLVNSWTKNEVETEGPTLYAQDDTLYFVVQLKDTIRHFFLPGWFDDMTAPVTAVAMMSKTAVAVPANTNSSSDSSEPTKPSSPNMPTMDLLPDMPFLPDNPLVISEELKNTLNLSKNRNVIIGNWEVQNKYKGATGDMLATYQRRFTSNVYDKAWNHFQDAKNHYTTGDLYRKNTVNILDDVTADGRIPGTYTSIKFGGNGSNVCDTPAALNDNEESTAYNPGKNKRGYPYLGERVDSLNIDFKQDVTFSEDKNDPSYKWLLEDWDITLDEWDGIKLFDARDWGSWGSANKDSVKKLRVHASLNFNGAYEVRTNEDFLEKDENGKPVVDILWVRIESEPMLYHPDSLDGGKTGNVKIPSLNSVNQIIINVNASNYDTATKNYRPVVMFYDGPESNDDIDIDIDIDKKYKSRTDVLHRKSLLPIILNLNKPFRGVLYAPNSPVVIIGDNKDYFQGFVVAKKYMRLKDESDFVVGDPPAEPTILTALSIYGLRTYYAKEDTAKKTPYYKVTDENGIEMFVDERGDIQFADLPAPPTRYGTYDNFDRTDFSTEGYKVLQSSADNMLLSGE